MHNLRKGIEGDSFTQVLADIITHRNHIKGTRPYTTRIVCAIPLVAEQIHKHQIQMRLNRNGVHRLSFFKFFLNSLLIPANHLRPFRRNPVFKIRRVGKAQIHQILLRPVILFSG